MLIVRAGGVGPGYSFGRVGSMGEPPLLLARLMRLDRRRDVVDGLHRLSRHGGVGYFQAVIFVECDHQLQGVHGVQAQAAGAEEGLVVADFFRRDLQHKVLDEHGFDLWDEWSWCVHVMFDESGLTKRAPIVCRPAPVMLTLAAWY